MVAVVGTMSATQPRGTARNGPLCAATGRGKNPNMTNSNETSRNPTSRAEGSPQSSALTKLRHSPLLARTLNQSTTVLAGVVAYTLRAVPERLSQRLLNPEIPHGRSRRTTGAGSFRLSGPPTPPRNALLAFIAK